MLVLTNKLRVNQLVYRGVLFDYINGRTYGPCFTLRLEAVEWAEKETLKDKYPKDCQKMVMWDTCEIEGEAPEMEGAKLDTIP
jgi:hypothetical protein